MRLKQPERLRSERGGCGVAQESVAQFSAGLARKWRFAAELLLRATRSRCSPSRCGACYRDSAEEGTRLPGSHEALQARRGIGSTRIQRGGNRSIGAGELRWWPREPAWLRRTPGSQEEGRSEGESKPGPKWSPRKSQGGDECNATTRACRSREQMRRRGTDTPGRKEEPRESLLRRECRSGTRVRCTWKHERAASFAPPSTDPGESF